MIRSMHSTPVYVHDQEAALAFYTGTLGFRVVDDVPMGEQRWIVVAPQDGETGISLQRPGGMGEEAGPGTVGGHTGISFVAGNVQALYDELVAKGVIFTGEPESMPWGGKGAHFSDPDGNLFFVAGA